MTAQATSTVQSWPETRMEFLFELCSFWRPPCAFLDIGDKANVMTHLWRVLNGEDYSVVSKLQTKKSNCKVYVKW